MALREGRGLRLIGYSCQLKRGRATPPPLFLLRLLDSLMIGKWIKFEKIYVRVFLQGNDLKTDDCIYNHKLIVSRNGSIGFDILR